MVEASGTASPPPQGKLLPYFIVQLAMFALMVAILDLWLGVGFRGTQLLMTIAAMLLIVAYQMIGSVAAADAEPGGKAQPDGHHRPPASAMRASDSVIAM
jgi:hypothetical protein